jgi:hypothetical protein
MDWNYGYAGKAIPTLKIVVEHVTTSEGVEFVKTAGPNVAATITAHHLLYNRNAIFKGGKVYHLNEFDVISSHDILNRCSTPLLLFTRTQTRNSSIGIACCCHEW